MNEEQPKDLMSAILTELERARELHKMYEEIPMGMFGAIEIKQLIAKTETAISEDDVVKMLICFEELKSLE